MTSELNKISLKKSLTLFIVILLIVFSSFTFLFMFTTSLGNTPEDLIGKKAPDFTYNDQNNNTITLSEKIGEPVLLEFFISSCHFCYEQNVFLETVLESSPGLTIISISIDPINDNQTSILEYIDRFSNVSWSFVIDNNLVARDSYFISVVPVCILIDSEGIVTNVFVGVTSAQQILDALN